MIEYVTLSAGIILLVGLIGGELGNKVKLPSITGYLLAGLILGPSVLDVFPKEVLNNLDPLNDLALGIIAVTIGGELSVKRIKEVKQKIPPIFVTEVILTFILVTGVTYLISNSIPISLVLGVLGLATAPASILHILKEYKAQGEFPKLLKSLVAFDYLLCIIAFGVITSLLNILFYQSVTPDNGVLLAVFGDIFISILIGCGLGIVLVFLNKYFLSKEKLLLINLAFVLMGVGVAARLGLPSLFIAMIMGIVITNFSSKQRSFFETFRKVEYPILVIFFTLAGIKLNLGILDEVGLLAAGYILARLLGKIGGARLGSLLSKDMAPVFQKNMGMALTPQAGVVIGLAILAEQKLPIEEGLIITLILTTVIFFEIVGPILVKFALKNCNCIDEGEGEELTTKEDKTAETG